MDKKDNDVNRFWNKYHEAVIKNGVSEKYADYYVKWAQKFALSIKGKPLNKRTLDDIRQFISKVKNYKNVPEWKVKQVREAINAFFLCNFAVIPFLLTAQAEAFHPVKCCFATRFADLTG